MSGHSRYHQISEHKTYSYEETLDLRKSPITKMIEECHLKGINLPDIVLSNVDFTKGFYAEFYVQFKDMGISKEKIEEKVIKTPKEVVKEAKPIKNEDKKSPPDTITTKMTFDVINSLKNNYDIKSGVLEDMPLNLEYLCSGDEACHFYAGKNQVQVIYKLIHKIWKEHI